MDKGRHTVRLMIGGMTCQGCVQTVQNVLSSIPVVEDMDIDLASGVAEILIEDGSLTGDQLVMAVKMAGYNAILMD